MAVFWKNGSLVEAEQATLSVFDHGLLYGDGIFEGLRFYNRVIFKTEEHLERLWDSATAIGLEIPYSKEALTSALYQCVDHFPEHDGYLRLVVTRGEGKLGIDPASCKNPSVFIIADHLALVPDAIRSKGAEIIIASTRKLAADGLDPRVKSLNYLNHIMARMEANRANADEAVLLNAQGKVTEGSADNIFIYRDRTLKTPPVSDGALDGITRQTILEIASQLGVKTEETSLTAYDLYTADECFLTGTGAELIPVTKIDGRTIGDGSFSCYQKLSDGFHRYIDDFNRSARVPMAG